MSIKVCPSCKLQNAASNRNCIKCSSNLTRVSIRSDRKKQHGNLYLAIIQRLFSSALAGGVVVSLFFALMTYLEQPNLSLFTILN